MLRALFFVVASALLQLQVAAAVPMHDFIQLGKAMAGKCESPIATGMLMETGNSIYYVAHSAPSSLMGIASNETDASGESSILTYSTFIPARGRPCDFDLPYCPMALHSQTPSYS